MSLAEYQPHRETITSRGLSVQVRGLALDDVTMLFQKNMDDINKLFEIYGKGQPMVEQISESVQIATRLISEAPGVAARVIALACDEPEEEEKARKLTLPLQIKVIQKIIELTFEEAGGVRNFQTSLRLAVMAMIGKPVSNT